MGFCEKENDRAHYRRRVAEQEAQERKAKAAKLAAMTPAQRKAEVWMAERNLVTNAGRKPTRGKHLKDSQPANLKADHATVKAQWDDLIQSFVAKGMAPRKAVMAAGKANPTLRNQLVKSANTSNSGSGITSKSKSRFSRPRIVAHATANQIDVFGMIEDGAQHLFIRALRNVDQSQPLTINIDSHGGCMLPACAMFDSVRNYPGPIKCRITTAISAAGFFALSFQEREMTRHGSVMLHEPYFAEPEKVKQSDWKILSKLREHIVSAIASLPRFSPKAASDMLKTDTWFNADEALSYGLITRIV